MRNLIVLFVLMVSTFSFSQSTNIYDYSFIDIDGKEVSLKQFKGKKILFVNVASKCGFTPQYKDLQELHEQYQDKLVIIGFPCDQFAHQEPGTKEEIKAFCQKNYGVSFLMASKIDVKGKEQHPIYRWLTTANLNNVEDSKVSWNFSKYLVDEKGNYIKHFNSKVSPKSKDIINLLD